MVDCRDRRAHLGYRAGRRLPHSHDSWRSRDADYQAFDQDVWVTALHYDKRDPRKSFEQFCALRAANLALLKTLTPEQWEHYGMHSERGKESVAHIARMFAGHDINHLGQIERILAAKKK